MYSIRVIEYGSNHEVELCRVSTNPDAVVRGLKQKTLTIEAQFRRFKINKYNSIRVINMEQSQ